MKVAVIGGGAAGMMAAIIAAERMKEFSLKGKVCLFEKNDKLGSKVMISGGGRCNITTGLTDVKKVLENYPRGAAFLRTAMHSFSPAHVVEWFNDHGVKTKVEDDMRVFPMSDNGETVVRALSKAMAEADVEVIFNSKLLSVERTQEKRGLRLVFEGGTSEIFDKVIIATGGNAYRSTGSTGDGYAFAKALGHHLVALAPSLGAFTLADGLGEVLAGVSFPDAELSLICDAGEQKVACSNENVCVAENVVGDKKKTARASICDEKTGKKMFKRRGPFVFTHRGVSGPAVFALSAMSAYELINWEKPATLKIDFCPGVSTEKFREYLDGLIETNGKKHIVSLLDMFLPRSLSEVMAARLGISSDINVSRMNRDERKAICKEVKEFTLKMVGKSNGDEFVTAGGVDLAEVDSKTMESKICPGLFFAGEVLDVDAFTGGFNLQAAWCSGRAAGMASVKEKV